MNENDANVTTDATALIQSLKEKRQAAVNALIGGGAALKAIAVAPFVGLDDEEIRTRKTKVVTQIVEAEIDFVESVFLALPSLPRNVHADKEMREEYERLVDDAFQTLDNLAVDVKGEGCAIAAGIFTGGHAIRILRALSLFLGYLMERRDDEALGYLYPRVPFRIGEIVAFWIGQTKGKLRREDVLGLATTSLAVMQKCAEEESMSHMEFTASQLAFLFFARHLLIPEQRESLFALLRKTHPLPTPILEAMDQLTEGLAGYADSEVRLIYDLLAEVVDDEAHLYLPTDPNTEEESEQEEEKVALFEAELRSRRRYLALKLLTSHNAIVNGWNRCDKSGDLLELLFNLLDDDDRDIRRKAAESIQMMLGMGLIHWGWEGVADEIRSDYLHDDNPKHRAAAVIITAGAFIKEDDPQKRSQMLWEIIKALTDESPEVSNAAIEALKELATFASALYDKAVAPNAPYLVGEDSKGAMDTLHALLDSLWAERPDVDDVVRGYAVTALQNIVKRVKQAKVLTEEQRWEVAKKMETVALTANNLAFDERRRLIRLAAFLRGERKTLRERQ